MRRFLQFLIVCLINVYANVAVADTAKGATTVDDPVVWSLAALSDTLRYFYQHHCPIAKAEIYELSDFIMEQNPTASITELATFCQQMTEPKLSSSLWEIKVKKHDGCPSVDGEKKPGYEQKTGPSVKTESCQYFVNELVKRQQEFILKRNGLRFKAPGTYVERVAEGVYRVIDVVTEKEADEAFGGARLYPHSPTAIYVVSEDWGPEYIGLETEDPDMFINHTTTNQTNGIFNNSYIYTNVDLTDEISDLSRFGKEFKDHPAVYSVLSYELRSGHPLDIKARHCNGKIQSAQFLRREGQTEVECYTNGVWFNGRIVTLEWLGHNLFGQRRENDTLLSGSMYDRFAGREQTRTSARTQDGQASDDGNYNMSVQDTGSRRAAIERHFAHERTDSVDKAVALIESYMYGLGYLNISCPMYQRLECDTPGQDGIICYTDADDRFVFEFADICSNKPTNRR